MIKFGKWEDTELPSCRKSLMQFPDGTCIMKAVVCKSVNDVWCFFLIDKEYGVGNAPRAICESIEQAKFVGDLYLTDLGFDLEENYWK